MDKTASYITAHEDGRLKKALDVALKRMASCDLCPRNCGVNRLEGEPGICKTGALAWVSSFCPHFGEEAPLVGRKGSGTIFFTHCNLLCNFCQNYEISHQGEGRPVEDDELAEIMLSLQRMGCHNINFVTPTHVVPQILSALSIAVQEGLSVPLIYNSSGYDRADTLALLDGIIDIYMPDFKFWDPGVAKMTCNAPDYPEVARMALSEMHRQVGELSMDENGLAVRGLLIRHLVLPFGLAGTRQVMHFIGKNLSKKSYVNIMAQYRPCGAVEKKSRLNRGITGAEYRQAIESAEKEGITRLDMRRPVFLIW